MSIVVFAQSRSLRYQLGDRARNSLGGQYQQNGVYLISGRLVTVSQIAEPVNIGNGQSVH